MLHCRRVASEKSLWIPSTGWWNSANCLTVITDLAAIDSNVKSSVAGVLSNTHVKAQQYNLNMTKVQGTESQPFLPQCYYGNQWPYFPPSWSQKHGRPPARKTSGFLNDYYDDEGWWALAWIAAYDLTKSQQYLSQAEAIFDDMNAVFGKTNCSTNSGGRGGIWWDRPQTYVNAIANELFLSVAASLANRAPSSKTDYLAISKQQWAWFKGTGMINAQNTINDGLNQQTCQNNGGTVWSYNQGVVLGGLVELSKATKDTSYIATAQKIADAAIAALAPNGILQDPCEPDCGADGTQFKGVFVRNLQKLHTASPKARYANFLDTNANSIWANDRRGSTLSVRWSSFVPPGNASTQSSAMDCLVASLAT
ncbi:glycoside hydrolase family 76 protein [Pseudocercospora fijiensis CIRAD86]|uniref:Glycoside hydrolase family 76 protein n=1 Tax=Pseudocercospora fijiensis (strain CIRAD86) TaxID=383855 RepID=M3AS89_PSEFD|nr:glycoside hydrolase family 76 protein [Pseudocercospora fijiensis CIRAD86]EME80018.1 glycoside hydrolase family 76 protein [Pseudocercospora fijiensis CIRAD86]